MSKDECQFPEDLQGREPGQCSCAQMRKCHERSGGKHPLPSMDKIRAEQEAEKNK